MDIFSENIQLLLQFPTIRRVLIAGPLIAVASALLGVGLVTGRRAMISDGLSHVSFCSVAIALAIGVAPTALSIPIVIITAMLLLRSGGEKRSDTSVALISGGALAIGTFILSTVQGMNMSVSDYMFGSILTLSSADTIICIISTLIVLFVFILLYRPVFAISFDETFASASGIGSGKYNSVLSALTAVIIVVGMKIMGVMLVTALIVFPTISAFGICKSYRATILFTAISSACCFTVGIIISLLFSLPTGASVVIIYLGLLVICHTAGHIRRCSLRLYTQSKNLS